MLRAIATDFRVVSVLLAVVGCCLQTGCKECENSMDCSVGQVCIANECKGPRVDAGYLLPDTETEEDNIDVDTEGFDDVDTDKPDTELCAEFDLTIEYDATRLMILQDFSGSMCDGTPSKWNQAVAALTDMLTKYDPRIEFGFDIFPNDGLCSVLDPVKSDCAAANGQAIISILNSIYPNGGTPLYDGMNRFTQEGYAPVFQGLEFTSYLLIVSDGADTCGIGGDMADPVTPEALTALTSTILNDHGIMTFVIGFGFESSSDQLNAIAAAGGTPFSEYIDAQNQQDLQAAFGKIAAIAIGCEFETVPQDEDEVDFDAVKFYFDGVEVGWDPDCAFDKGWTWMNQEYTRVLFCEEACNKLKTGQVQVISATFGCPPLPITE